MTRHPSPSVDDLAVTHDESPDTLDSPPIRARTTGRVPRFDPDEMHAVGSGDMPPIHVTPTDLADSEWGRALKAQVDKNTCDMWWTKIIVWPGAGAVIAAAIAVIRLAYVAGGDSRDAKRHLAEHAATMAAMSTLQIKTLPDIWIAIAKLQTSLNAISRLGAVRVQGPAVQPLLPDGAP